MSLDSSFSSNVLSARSVFKRCVKCETAAPSCPACEEGSTCTMISQSCNQCATTKCIQTSSGGSSNNKSSGGGGGGNAGAIAGGVIGGIAFVAIVTGLFWWFFIRKKRNEYSLGGAGAGQEKRGGTSQQARKSTNSIASTVLTRASNVIQIAYIPGVTNRSPPDTPSSLVPPVPPLPGAAPDQHFFMPGDLRDSSFTDLSNDRRSGAPTISPSLRSSVATTYRNNAIVNPIPAQQATLTRAAVVSIHGNQPASQTAVITPPDAPAVPAITSAQLAKAGVNDANNKSSDSNNNSSIVARTMTAKPVMVKTLGSKKKKNNNNDATPAVQTIEERSENSAPVSVAASPNGQGDVMASGFDDSSDDEPESPGARSTKSVKRSDTVKTTASKAPTVIEDTPATEQSPFTDQQASTSESSTTQPTSDAQTAGSNRSSRAPPPPRVQSPFSDANELK